MQYHPCESGTLTWVMPAHEAAKALLRYGNCCCCACILRQLCCLRLCWDILELNVIIHACPALNHISVEHSYACVDLISVVTGSKSPFLRSACVAWHLQMVICLLSAESVGVVGASVFLPDFVEEDST